ncbi:MAG TPA: outer membrane beta-barrel protein, partial [Povalibacter sp.]|nr:outer membrane beta-barrel protein [Povalibacter sp.]
MTRANAAALGLAAVMGFAPGLPAAGSDAGRWYFVPQAGGIYVDDERGVESSDVLAGIAAGRYFGEHWAVELTANGTSLARDANPAIHLYGASVDALRFFGRERALAPYLTFGAGAVRSDPATGAADTDRMAQVGAGLKWRLGVNRRNSGSFSLRPELKLRWSDSIGGSMLDYIAQLGFQFAFGAPSSGIETASEPASVASAASVA